MNAAACSWRVRTSWIDDLRIDSTISRFSSPGIPKIRSTPSFSRAAISRSEPLNMKCLPYPRVAGLESQHFDIPHVGQRTKLVLNGLRQHLIHAHNGDGILLGGLAAQVKSRNIDIGFPQYGSQRADETRLVQVIDQEHHRMEVRFQGHALHFDDLRGSRVHYTGQRPPAPSREHLDPDQRSIDRGGFAS